MNNFKRREWLKTALGALGLAGAAGLRLTSAEGESEKKFSSEFGPDWDVAKAYTLEVAEAMPAEKYSFKPADPMRSFGEVLVHIGGSMYFMAASVRGAEAPAESKFAGEATKERVVSFLRGAFEYAAESVAMLDDTKASETVSVFGGRMTMSRAKLCQFMRDHSTHHRAYVLPYLRLNGVEPPRYRFAGRGPSPV
ncbi:MAG: DinB family protein [Candidatus Acidiferrales bacterium]